MNSLVAQSCLTHCHLQTIAHQSPLSMHSLGKNTGMSCHALLQGIFPAQGPNLSSLHCRQILYCLSHQGSHYYCLLINRSVSMLYFFPFIYFNLHVPLYLKLVSCRQHARDLFLLLFLIFALRCNLPILVSLYNTMVQYGCLSFIGTFFLNFFLLCFKGEKNQYIFCRLDFYLSLF